MVAEVSGAHPRRQRDGHALPSPEIAPPEDGGGLELAVDLGRELEEQEGGHGRACDDLCTKRAEIRKAALSDHRKGFDAFRILGAAWQMDLPC